MNRRNALALLIALLIMPLVRFLERWNAPAFRDLILINGVRYEWSSVSFTYGAQTFDWHDAPLEVVVAHDARVVFGRTL